VCFSNYYLEKRFISIEGKYSTSLSSSFRGLLLMPSISILTVLLPSSITGLLAVNIVCNKLLFRVYNSKFVYIYIIYFAVLLSKYQEYLISPDLVKRATTDSISLSSLLSLYFFF
jgi:hypothetical protein